MRIRQNNLRLRLIVALLGLAGWGRGQSPGPRLSRLDPPAAPVTSKDGTVSVCAPVSTMRYRAPVFMFVDRTRNELARVTRMSLGTPACPLVVQLGGQRDGDRRVLSARQKDRGGGVREVIELPDPEAADLEQFRRAICLALLRSWMAGEAKGEGERAVEPPGWLIAGLVRYMGRETRQEDVDRTLLLWSRACLPPAGQLFAAESPATSREPAVAAVLAGWLLEKREGGTPFEMVLRRLASGERWSPAVAGRLLADTEDASAFDEAADLWLSSLGRSVVKPGQTSAGIMRRFRSRLLLYPAFYGTTWGNNCPWLTFGEAVQRSDDPGVRREAADQAGLVRLAAVGRDGMLLAVADAYSGFLEALAKGEEKSGLFRRLQVAEGLRGELERRTAKGLVLQRP